jgi:uncharacterized DUF497 family protein
MDIGFVWDQTKYQKVVKDHGVHFYEVVAAFDDPNGIESQNLIEHEERCVGFGLVKLYGIGCWLSFILMKIYRCIASLQLLMQKGDCTMNTINDDEFDFPAFVKNNPPDPANIRRGIAAREQRVQAAMQRPAVRIESEILTQIQSITASGQSAEQVINQALREWLSAKDFKEMLRGELHDAVQEAFLQAGAATTQNGKTE